MTLEELKQNLVERGYEDAIVLERPDYVDAVVGTSSDGRVIYDYEKMLDYLVEHEGMRYEEAADFLSYDTMRALPYMGEKAPIILEKIDQ